MDINSYTSAARAADNRAERGPRAASGAGRANAVSAQAGLNRFVWDMRYTDAEGIDGGTYLFGGSVRGPEAAPGEYRVRVTVGEQPEMESVESRTDPRVPNTQQDSH